jgi:fibro-slime domain-containing protein
MASRSFWNAPNAISLRSRTSCILAVVLICSSGVSAKTVMVLLDGWNPLPSGSSIVSENVTYNPASTRPDGGTSPKFVRSNAYTSRPFTKWYALTDFSMGDFFGNIVLGVNYEQRDWKTFSDTIGATDSLVTFPDTQNVVTYKDPLTSRDTTVALAQTSPRRLSIPARAILYSTKSVASSNLLRATVEGKFTVWEARTELERCFVDLQSDTIWIRMSKSAGSLRRENQFCTEHNPELPSQGEVRFYSPISGAKVEALSGGLVIPMQRTLLDEWHKAQLYGSPGEGDTAKVSFRVTTRDGRSWTFDSAGSPYTVTNSLLLPHIHPAMAGAQGFRHGGPPASQVVLAWTNPWPDRLPQLTFGGPERLTGTPHPGGWRSAILWVRPTSAWLVSVDGEERTASVEIPGTGWLDTIWLTPRPVAQAPTSIAVDGFDYLSGTVNGPAYFPFTELTNSALTRGLLKERIGPGGKLARTGRSICGLLGPYNLETTGPCVAAANAPDKWFDSVAVSGGAANAKVSFQIAVGQDSVGFYRMGGKNFFPLDSLRINPLFYDQILGSDSIRHNFAFCFVVRGMIQPGPGYQLEAKADDDTWIYVDSQLVVDMGGQHASVADTIHYGSLRVPLPSVVPIDIYHCERHTNEAVFSIRTNTPIYPVGAIRLPNGGTSSSRAPITGTRLQFRAGQILVQMPASQAWTLEMRGLDGRVLSRWTGTGARNIPVQGTGMRFLRLTAGSTRMQISTLMH